MLAFGSMLLPVRVPISDMFCPARACGTPSKRSQRITTRAAGGKDKADVPDAAATQSPAPLRPMSPESADLYDRIQSGEFTDAGSTKERITRPMRRFLASDPTGLGRFFAYQLAKLGRGWRQEAAQRMPEARGDMREIIGEPVFIPLYKLFLAYGDIFRLTFGPKTFVVLSNPKYAKQVLYHNADKYSKGILSEILEFVMGTGLIPADGAIWKARRRAIVPALHKKYVASMVNMFGDSTLHGCVQLDAAAAAGRPVEMENFFSRLSLDIIGKAVFNYDFDSLTHDDPVIKAVYTTLREAEYRSTFPIPYWDWSPLQYIVPRQRDCIQALQVINKTLDELISKCKRLVDEEDEEFVDEFLSKEDPSILHFLIASGDDISSKQLRDDLMTLLIAGHETTAAVLTWTFSLLVQHPDVIERLHAEVDEVLGDRLPTIADIRALRLTTRVINESMRLFPQPPVLIRRALEEDQFGDYKITPGTDLFISVWNLHHSPWLWEEPERFNPDRFGPLDDPIPNESNQGYKFLPFGGGRRKCIGDQFALFEAVVALAMLVRRYNFEMAPDAPAVGMTTGATIHTINGLYLSVKRRTPPPTPSAREHELSAANAGSSNGSSSQTAPAYAAASNGASAPGGCPMHGNGNGNGNGVQHAQSPSTVENAIKGTSDVVGEVKPVAA